ncbi:MAG: histidinol-phosphatase HisJ family protein [Faecalimonas sp.]|nr:histidinol-phosphatase HisJ family protein [Faecalimonas sp.]
MLADFHMHTTFSSDADENSTPERMIEAAIQKGLQAICITDHQDLDVGKNDEFQINFEAYFKTLLPLQDKYKDRIDVRIGLEFGMQTHLGAVCNELVQAYPFDFVIGSGHFFDGMDPYYPGYFDGRTDEEGYRKAFEITLEDLKVTTDFDVLGHLDYVVRYGRKKEQEYSYARYADIIDEILRNLIENGKGLELNTGGLKYGLPFAHPHPEVLKRYRELGGEILTIGSDAHKPEHIAYDFDKVSAILQGCGFGYYTEFRQRKPVFRKLV